MTFHVGQKVVCIDDQQAGKYLPSGFFADFPEGKLTKTDEGAIQFAVGEKDGKVVLDFGTPVNWVGMNPQQAADLASLLMKRAREVGRKNGETITFMIG